MKGCPPLTPRQLRLALRQLKGRYRWRNRALVILGVRTGMRISELLALRVAQIHDGNAILPRVYLRRKSTKGKRQGALIALHPKAAVALQKWLALRSPVSGNAWLFPSQRSPGHPMGRHAAWHILHRAFLAAGSVAWRAPIA